MVNIIKKIREVKEIQPMEKVDLSLYHKELEKISSKFLGLTSDENSIRDIVVEQNMSEVEIQQLKTRLQELVDDPEFGKVQ